MKRYGLNYKMTAALKNQNRSGAPGRREALLSEQWLSEIGPELAGRLKLSWASAMATDTRFGQVFYEKLFARQKGVAELFTGDMDQQQRRLTNTLAEAVKLVENPAQLILLLRATGVRHRQYRVRHGHFAVMQEALLETLSARLEKEFDSDLRADWQAFFHHMSVVMRDAMARASN